MIIMKHNKRNTKLYNIWCSIKQRCYNPNNEDYHNYGGRGIKMYQDWVTEFINFYNWAINNGYDENAPYGKCTIDRINTDGDYEPNNCRWVDMKIQSNNKRDNYYIEYKGETKTLKEWSEIFNIKYTTLKKRLLSNWKIEDALELPVEHRKRKN